MMTRLRDQERLEQNKALAQILQRLERIEGAQQALHANGNTSSGGTQTHHSNATQQTQGSEVPEPSANVDNEELFAALMRPRKHGTVPLGRPGNDSQGLATDSGSRASSNQCDGYEPKGPNIV